MKHLKLASILLTATFAAHSAPLSYDADCRIELRNLNGELQSEVRETVLLNRSGRPGSFQKFSGKMESPIENLPQVISLDVNGVSFTTDIKYARKSGLIRTYLVQANQGRPSRSGYRAPGPISYGQSRTQFFPVAQLNGFQFFQENVVHDGTPSDNGGPTCYPQCPPRGPYDGPTTIELPAVGKLNVFCQLMARP